MDGNNTKTGRQKDSGKTKRNRRAYLNDFKKNSEGTYEYQGQIYVWEASPGTCRKERIILGTAGLAAAVCILLAGCLSAPGMMNCVYVILPYTVSFVCGFSTLWGLARLLKTGQELRAYVYEATVIQVPRRASGTILGAAVTILNECIYLFLHGAEGQMEQALLFLGANGIAIAALFLLAKRVKNIKWRKVYP